MGDGGKLQDVCIIEGLGGSVAANKETITQPKVHINAILLDEIATVCMDTAEILWLEHDLSDLLKESIRLRALFAYYSYTGKEVSILVDGETLDPYALLGIKKSILR